MEQSSITVEAIAEAHPKNVKPVAAQRAICDKIDGMVRQGKTFEQAAAYLLERTRLYAEYISRWPKERFEFVPESQNWFLQGCYAAKEHLWEYHGKENGNGSENPAITALRKAAGRQG